MCVCTSLHSLHVAGLKYTLLEDDFVLKTAACAKHQFLGIHLLTCHSHCLGGRYQTFSDVADHYASSVGKKYVPGRGGSASPSAWLLPFLFFRAHVECHRGILHGLMDNHLAVDIWGRDALQKCPTICLLFDSGTCFLLTGASPQLEDVGVWLFSWIVASTLSSKLCTPALEKTGSAPPFQFILSGPFFPSLALLWHLHGHSTVEIKHFHAGPFSSALWVACAYGYTEPRYSLLPH